MKPQLIKMTRTYKHAKDMSLGDVLRYIEPDIIKYQGKMSWEEYDVFRASIRATVKTCYRDTVKEVHGMEWYHLRMYEEYPDRLYETFHSSSI